METQTAVKKDIGVYAAKAARGEVGRALLAAVQEKARRDGFDSFNEWQRVVWKAYIDGKIVVRPAVVITNKETPDGTGSE